MESLPLYKAVTHFLYNNEKLATLQSCHSSLVLPGKSEGNNWSSYMVAVLLL